MNNKFKKKIIDNKNIIIFGIIFFVMLFWLGGLIPFSIVQDNIFSSPWEKNISASGNAPSPHVDWTGTPEKACYNFVGSQCSFYSKGMALNINLIEEFDNNNLKEIIITSNRNTYHTGYNSNSNSYFMLFSGNSWNNVAFELNTEAKTYYSGTTWRIDPDPVSKTDVDIIKITEDGVYKNNLKVANIEKVFVANRNRWYFNDEEITKLYLGHKVYVSLSVGNGGVINGILISPLYSSGNASSDLSIDFVYNDVVDNPPIDNDVNIFVSLLNTIMNFFRSLFGW